MKEHDFMSILKGIVENKTKEFNYYSDLMELAKTYSKFPGAKMYGPLVVYSEKTDNLKVKKWHFVDIRNGWGYYFDKTFTVRADVSMTSEYATKLLRNYMKSLNEEIKACEELCQLITNK